jgi:hypothetical protein
MDVVPANPLYVPTLPILIGVPLGVDADEEGGVALELPPLPTDDDPPLPHPAASVSAATATTISRIRRAPGRPKVPGILRTLRVCLTGLRPLFG